MSGTAVPRTARSSARRSSQALERETRLVREAIAMVASGASPRVIIAGIRSGEAILASMRRLGLESGVRVNPMWRDDDPGADIVVEPIHE